jgi:hypothetical protein
MSVVAALGAATMLLTGFGCLDEPEIEDRWTRVDLQSSNLLPNQAFAPGATIPVTVRAQITYRKIITGFLVAELRQSTVPINSVVVHPDAERVTMANSIDQILANSVTRGRATRAFTGWDHLQQVFDLTFTGTAPGSATDSTGSATGFYLLCYLGEGEEIELGNGQDSLVVTPFPSVPYELLPVGMELTVAPPGPN